jgi:hypothetical protein
MIRALVVKELREVLGIAAVGLAVCLVGVAALTGMKPFADWLPLGRHHMPFHEQAILPPLACAGVLLTLALGFRQTAGEAARGTFLFLLHRPVRRELPFLIKLGTGLTVYLLCTGVALLLYAWWAATPGHYPGPFEWSMTADAWRLWLLLPLLYLGAFLSGLRPAPWYGTRLLPLAAGVVCLMWLFYEPGWPLGWALTAAVYGLFATSICYVARVRDYA